MFCANCGKEIGDGECPICTNKRSLSTENASEGKVFEIFGETGIVMYRRRRLTIIKVNNIQVGVISYAHLNKKRIVSVKTFDSRDIVGIYYAKKPMVTKMDIVNYIIASLISFIPPYIFGVPIAILTYVRSLGSAMIIQLNDGNHIPIFYSDEEDTSELYKLLSEKVDAEPEE